MSISMIIGLLFLALGGRLLWGYFHPFRVAGKHKDTKEFASKIKTKGITSLFILSGKNANTIYLIASVLLLLVGIWLLFD